MFERYTDRARKVMALANQVSQRFNHEYVGPEHILLGLLCEGSGGGARFMKDRGIDLSKVRVETEKKLRSGPDMVTIGKLPKTPAGKKVIELAIIEARYAGHNWVGTEDLLLGLIREEESLAAQVLAGFGLEESDLPALRKEIFVPDAEATTDADATEDSPHPNFLLTTALFDEFVRHRAVKLLASALDEAQAMGLRYPRPEHVLLAFFREPQGIVAKALANLGVKEQVLRDQIAKLSKEPPNPDRPQ
jgi:ATP-dependent Clp protease ATP-binding subunit ClpA